MNIAERRARYDGLMAEVRILRETSRDLHAQAAATTFAAKALCKEAGKVYPEGRKEEWAAARKGYKRCAGTTRKGEPCRALVARFGSSLCGIHEQMRTRLRPNEVYRHVLAIP